MTTKNNPTMLNDEALNDVVGGGGEGFDFVQVNGSNTAGDDLQSDGTSDVITATGPGGGPHVRVFDGTR